MLVAVITADVWQTAIVCSSVLLSLVILGLVSAFCFKASLKARAKMDETRLRYEKERREAERRAIVEDREREDRLRREEREFEAKAKSGK